MEYLLLAVLIIIIYAEVLPTISIIFELIRTWIASKIAVIQQCAIHVQEDIKNTQDRMEHTSTHVIGFNTEPERYELEVEDGK